MAAVLPAHLQAAVHLRRVHHRVLQVRVQVHRPAAQAAAPVSVTGGVRFIRSVLPRKMAGDTKTGKAVYRKAPVIHNRHRMVQPAGVHRAAVRARRQVQVLLRAAVLQVHPQAAAHRVQVLPPVLLRAAQAVVVVVVPASMSTRTGRHETGPVVHTITPMRGTKWFIKAIFIKLTGIPAQSRAAMRPGQVLEPVTNS